MREILFRGKRVDNGALETGSLVILWQGTSREQVYIADKVTGYHTPVDPDTVGQYTGLTDKNGKRIFEGDVIRFSFKTITTDYVVEWHNGGFVFRDVKIRAIGSDLVQSDADNAEIVGNIHDRR